MDVPTILESFSLARDTSKCHGDTSCVTRKPSDCGYLERNDSSDTTFKHFHNDTTRGDIHSGDGSFISGVGSLPVSVTAVIVSSDPKSTPEPWPAWTPLEIALMHWGAKHHPDAAKALLNATGRDYCLRCLGSMVRRRAKQDLRWLWDAAVAHGPDLLALSPFIGTIDLGGVAWTVPGRMGWRRWIESQREVEEILFIDCSATPVDLQCDSTRMAPRCPDAGAGSIGPIQATGAEVSLWE